MIYLFNLNVQQELNINITGINPAYMMLPTHDIPGHRTIYVECQCGKDEREMLFDKLRKSASGAIKVQLYNDHEGIDKSVLLILYNCLRQ